jgi:hypothetical protein
MKYQIINHESSFGKLAKKKKVKHKNEKKQISMALEASSVFS